MYGVRNTLVAGHSLGLRSLPVLVVLCAVVACGGNDGGTAPSEVSFSGTYYGQVVFGAATCTPKPPPSDRFDTRAYSFVTLWEAQQDGARVTITDAADQTQFAGTVTANGDVAVEASFAFGDTKFDVTGRQRLALRLSGRDHLTGTGDVMSEARQALTNAFFTTCTRSFSVDLSRRTAPVPDLQAGTCSQEPNLRSLRGDDRALLLVRNRSARAVRVFWRNYEGLRDLEWSLEPGGLVGISTFVTHPFVVTDATGGQCLGIYQPVLGPARATIQ